MAELPGGNTGFSLAQDAEDLFIGKSLLHGDVLTLLMKTLLTSRCINQRGAGRYTNNAQPRRSRPTIHRQYGENAAILVAVALLSRAFGVVAEAQLLPHACKTQVVVELSTTVGLQGRYGGNILKEEARSAETILLTNELETSRLFDATLQMAAIVADASSQARQRLRYCTR
uniref:polyprenyl synthetase family protein n=1 Tax=Pantoea sp. IMH TaxID=1267600 RepID=UPI00046AD280|nr:polyprenyl synthetase family protein [Pantoea sp. IMH]